jgi:hypothetical protein
MANRGRKPIEIDKNHFQDVVSELESNKTFPTRTALWEAVCETEWAKTRIPRPLTPQVALLKAEEFNLQIKTPKGMRGITKGSHRPSRVPKKKREFSMEEVEKRIPPEERKKLQKTIQKAKTGSLKARIKLNCLDCCCWQIVEVAKCPNKHCPLWDVRPYKRSETVISELTVIS